MTSLGGNVRRIQPHPQGAWYVHEEDYNAIQNELLTTKELLKEAQDGRNLGWREVSDLRSRNERLEGALRRITQQTSQSIVDRYYRAEAIAKDALSDRKGTV